jgi:hypothetical protein
MIPLYLDEDVHKKIATALRLKGYDAVSGHEVHKQSLSDRDQLDYAIAQGRAIFTFNVGDFSRLHAEFQQQGKKHHGILLSKQISLGDSTKRLSQFLFSHSAEKISNSIYWI